MKMKNKRTYLIVSILLAVALIAGAIGIYARYVSENGTPGNGGVVAAETKLYADKYLVEAVDGAYPTYSVYATSASFTINASGKYNITIQKSGTTVSPTAITPTNGAYTHTVSGNVGETYEVIATLGSSTEKPLKTIGAKLVFAEPQPTKFKVTDKGNAVVIDLYTGTGTGAIKINYGANLAPDNSNPLMSSWRTGGAEQSLTGFSENAHYELVFFKTANVSYSGSVEQTLPDNRTITIS